MESQNHLSARPTRGKGGVSDVKSSRKTGLRQVAEKLLEKKKPVKVRKTKKNEELVEVTETVKEETKPEKKKTTRKNKGPVEFVEE